MIWTVRKISHVKAYVKYASIVPLFANSNCIITLFLCMQVRDSVPLTLYSNGILMFGGPFRPYSDPVTQVSVYLTIISLVFIVIEIIIYLNS